jgi:TatD DNase family protein
VSWVDSHCHLQSLADPDAAIDRARDAGVVAMVCIGTDLETSEQAIALAARRPEVRATVGLHPHDASKLTAEWHRLDALAAADGVVGVGETGFDFHYTHSPADTQEAAFRAQIELANRLDRALVIHSRDAWDATFRVLGEERPPSRTIFHCFTGGPGEARRALDLGAYLSFSGIVTFPNADDLRAAAAIAPLDRLLVETDAPFLAPVPHRGRENEPALVALVGAALAAAKCLIV